MSPVDMILLVFRLSCQYKTEKCVLSTRIRVLSIQQTHHDVSLNRLAPYHMFARDQPHFHETITLQSEKDIDVILIVQQCNQYSLLDLVR